MTDTYVEAQLTVRPPPSPSIHLSIPPSSSIPTIPSRPPSIKGIYWQRKEGLRCERDKMCTVWRARNTVNKVPVAQLTPAGNSGSQRNSYPLISDPKSKGHQRVKTCLSCSQHWDLVKTVSLEHKSEGRVSSSFHAQLPLCPWANTGVYLCRRIWPRRGEDACFGLELRSSGFPMGCRVRRGVLWFLQGGLMSLQSFKWKIWSSLPHANVSVFIWDYSGSHKGKKLVNVLKRTQCNYKLCTYVHQHIQISKLFL